MSIRSFAPLTMLALALALVATPAAAAQAVTTSVTDTATDPTTDPTTEAPMSTIVIVAPANEAHLDGDPAALTIMCEAMSDTIGQIDVIVDGMIVKSCTSMATCDAAVELAAGDHTIDATLYDPANLPLASAESVIVHVHAAASTDTDATGTGTETVGTGTTADSASSGDGGDDKGACACRADGPPGPLALLLLGAPLLRRRRR